MTIQDGETYIFRSQIDTNFVIDLSAKNKQTIALWYFNGGLNQQWTAHVNQEGNFFFKNGFTDVYLGIQGSVKAEAKLIGVQNPVYFSYSDDPQHPQNVISLFITDTEPKLFLRNSRGVQNGKPINLELYASGNAKDEQLWFISRGGEITFDRHNPHSPGDSRSRNPSNSNGADRPGPRYKENIPVPKFFLSNNTSLAFYVAETLSSIQTAITSDMSAGWSFAESKDDFKKDVVSILGSLQMSDQVRYLIGEVLGQTQLVSSFSTIGTLLPPPPPAILPPPPTSQELSEVKAQVAEIQKTLKAIEERSANLDSVVMDAARNAVQLYSDSLKQSKTSMQQAQPTGLQHPLVYPPSFPEPDYTPTQAVNEEWPQSLPICCPECAKNKSLHESASCTTDGPLPLV